MINFFTEDTSFLLKGKLKFKAYIKELLKTEGFSLGDLSYIFCSDKHILHINQTYLQHDYYTDIITFDYSEENTISGDLFISVDTVTSNAAQFGQKFDTELARVMLHGVLHLCGYNDHTEQEITEMRAKEDFYLTKFELY